jgi:hypothetical protein
MRLKHWAMATAIVTSSYGCPRTIMCAPGEVMVEGRCAGDCPPGSTSGCRDTGVVVDAAALEAGDAISCPSGTHTCSGACVSNDAVTSCGTRCEPCPAPAGARPTCMSQQCGIECLAGFERVGESCEAVVPRPVFPPGTSMVTSHRPTFRWALGAGTDGAVVEVCRDRACTMRVTMFDATGTSARPAMALPASTALFWRLRGRVGAVAGSRFGPTWQFRTRATDASVDTAFGTELDFNGDGFSDVAIGAPGIGRGSVSLFFGGASGLSAPMTIAPPASDGTFGSAIVSVGDVNGDGFGDIAIRAIRSSGTLLLGVVNVYFGRADATIGEPTAITSAMPEESFGRAITGGDVNGDGWSDLVLGAASTPAVAGRSRGSFLVFNGSARGINALAGVRFDASSAFDRVGAAIATGDTNGDGFADLVVGAPAATSGATNGAVLRYLGGSAGLDSNYNTVASQSGGLLGSSVAASGDVNGDGIADIAIGAPAGGLVQTLLGSRTGAPINSTMLVGVGGVVAVSRDSNGDGFDETLVGPGSTALAYLYRGSMAGVTSTPALTITGPLLDNGRTVVLAAHADINGDGFGDFTVGAPDASPIGRDVAGLALVYFGGTTPMLHRTIEGARPLEQLGSALASRSTLDRPSARHPAFSAGGCVRR